MSTATDMINWTKALFRGSALSSQSLQQMTTPVQLTTSQGTALTMGFGLEVIDQDPWFGEKVYANSSTNPGMMTRLLYDPNTGRTIFPALNRCDQYDPAQLDASQVADDIITSTATQLYSYGTQ